MSSLLKLPSWPYTWYGYWQEYGPDYTAFPSAKQFVDPSRVAHYDLPRLLAYLRSGYPLWATSRANFPSPFTGQLRTGSLCLVTDGQRCWLDDVADYVEAHNLAIPDAWYAQIEANGFHMPVLTEEQLAQMEDHLSRQYPLV